MPQSACTLIEYLIILSQDSESDVSMKSNNVIGDLSVRLTADHLNTVFENLEEGLYNAINSLPRKFNSVGKQKN